jgi:hypothetical protein
VFVVKTHKPIPGKQLFLGGRMKKLPLIPIRNIYGINKQKVPVKEHQHNKELSKILKTTNPLESARKKYQEL